MMSYFRCGHLFITISYYPGANTGMKDVFPFQGKMGRRPRSGHYYGRCEKVLYDPAQDTRVKEEKEGKLT